MNPHQDKEFEDVRLCPLCGNGSSESVFKRGFFTGKMCGMCGMIFITPRLKDDRSVYTDDISSSTSRYYELASGADRRTFDKRLNMLEKYSVQSTSLLDIGCSTGTLMDTAARRGWKNVKGVEPNPASAEACRKKGGDVVNDFFSDEVAKRLSGQFDAVFAGDVIEHQKNPGGFLRLARQVLKENGVIMVVTPDYESTLAKLLQIKPLEHLLYFTEKSLRYSLENNGFAVEYIGSGTRERSFRAMPHSTTFTSGIMKFLIRILYFTGLSSLINLFLRIFAKDELIAIGRKKGK